MVFNQQSKLLNLNYSNNGSRLNVKIWGYWRIIILLISSSFNSVFLQTKNKELSEDDLNLEVLSRVRLFYIKI